MYLDVKHQTLAWCTLGVERSVATV